MRGAAFLQTLRSTAGPGAVLSLVLAAGCLKDTGDPPPSGSGIVPLAVGNAWAYVDSAYFGHDSLSVDSSRTTILGTRVVSAGGTAQTVFLSSGANPVTGEPQGQILYVQDRPDGSYTLGVAQDSVEFFLETLHVKYPAETGERYVTRFLSLRAEDGSLIPVIDSLEIEVADAEHACTVPAGTFPCVQYRGWRPGNVLFATTYYAPGIGYLGSEIVRFLEVGGELRQVLIVHRLAAYTLH